MRVKDILTEGPKDEHRLQLIGRYLLRAINKEVADARKYQEMDVRRGVRPEPPFVDMGYIKDIIPNKVLSHLYNRIGSVKLTVDFGREVKQVDGEFDFTTKEINIRYPANSKDIQKYIESIIVHELRHALDSSLSRGWAMADQPKSKFKDVENPQHPVNVRGGDYPYLALPHEINARFSQAQQAITSMIRQAARAGYDLTVKDMLASLHDIFDNYSLTDIFPSNAPEQIVGSTNPRKPLDNKDYQQLIKRAIKYFDHEKARLSKK